MNIARKSCCVKSWWKIDSVEKYYFAPRNDDSILFLHLGFLSRKLGIDRAVE